MRQIASKTGLTAAREAIYLIFMSKIVRRSESGTDKTVKKGPLHTNQTKLSKINLK